MAELYSRGPHRIFYRSSSFRPGLDVAVDFMYEDLTSILHLMHLTEVSSGLYYFDCVFSSLGTYVGVFYEDGKTVLTQNFLVITLKNSGGNLL